MNQKIKDKIEDAWLKGKLDDELYHKYQQIEQDKARTKLIHENDSIFTKIKRHSFLIIFSIIVLFSIALYVTARLLTPEQFSSLVRRTLNIIATNPITIIIVLIIFAPILLSSIFATEEKPDTVVRFKKNVDGSFDAEVFKNNKNHWKLSGFFVDNCPLNKKNHDGKVMTIINHSVWHWFKTPIMLN